MSKRNRLWYCNVHLAVRVLLLVGTAVQTASADTLITLACHSPAVSFGSLSKPASLDTMLVWIGDGKARMDAAQDISTIYDARTDSILTIYRKFEIYSFGIGTPFGDLPDSSASHDLSKGLAALSPRVISTVEETQERKVIGSWNCTHWIKRDSMPQMGVVLTTDIWTTESTGVDADLYEKVTNPHSNQMRVFSKPVHTMKISGLPILTVTGMQRDSSSLMPQLGGQRNEIVSIKSVRVAPGHYEVPAGYELYK